MARLASFSGWFSTCLLVGLLLPGPTAAGLVTIQFEGVVEADPPYPTDQFDLLPEIEPGDIFTGSYVYDDSVIPGALPGALDFDDLLYDFSDVAAASVRLDINGETFFLDSASQPTPSDVGGFTGLGITLRRGGRSSTESDGLEILENLLSLTLVFPGRTLVPDPLPVTVIVPDFALVGTPRPQPPTSFSFVRRQERTPDRFRIVDGVRVVVRSERTVSGFSGRITALAVVPEPTALNLAALVGFAFLVRRAIGSTGIKSPELALLS
jgi:hypothetical protein